MYKTIRVEKTREKTEQKLNELEKQGFRVICRYAANYLILHKRDNVVQ